MLTPIQKLMSQLCDGVALSQEQSHKLFSHVVRGEVSEVELAVALTAMKIRGETLDEIIGAAKALRDEAEPFPRPDGDLLDIVGTGGDGANTINISTTATFVAAAAGARVAKHGSRSVSSKSGASDLLGQFGVNLTLPAEQSAQCLENLGVTFLFAPHYHAGMRYAAPVRQQMKMRTLFNVLGPLINPARPNLMVLGVYDPSLARPIAEVLRSLHVDRALVVHGSGVDELAIHGDSLVVEINQDELTEYSVSPQSLGIRQHNLDDIRGGEPADNKAISEQLLGGGGTDAQKAAVAINAGAGLYVAGVAATISDGTELAMSTMSSGKALTLLQQYAEASQ